VGLLREINENLKAQQTKLSEIQVAIRAALSSFLTEEQRARKNELIYAIRQNRIAQRIKLDEITAAAEIEKDSQRVIDLRNELKILRAAWRKLAKEVEPLEYKGKQRIVSSEDEENPSA